MKRGLLCLLVIFSQCGKLRNNTETDLHGTKDSGTEGGRFMSNNCATDNLNVQCTWYTRYGRELSLMLYKPGTILYLPFNWNFLEEEMDEFQPNLLLQLMISENYTERCGGFVDTGSGNALVGHELSYQGVPVGCATWRMYGPKYTISQLCSGPFETACTLNFQSDLPLTPFLTSYVD